MPLIIWDLSERRKMIGSTTSSTSIGIKWSQKQISERSSIHPDEPANLFRGIFESIPAAFFSSDQPRSSNRPFNLDHGHKTYWPILPISVKTTYSQQADDGTTLLKTVENLQLVARCSLGSKIERDPCRSRIVSTAASVCFTWWAPSSSAITRVSPSTAAFDAQ